MRQRQPDMDILFETAVRLHSQNRLEEAETQYRAVLAVSPRHAGAMHRLAILYIQSSRISEAQELLQKAATAAPNDPQIRQHFGLLLLKLGRPAEAATEASAALIRKPEMAEAWNTLGLAQAAQGNLEQALISLGRAITRSPRDSEILKSLGEVYLRLDEPEAALDFFTKALALHPRMLVALLGRAEALSALGHQEEALSSTAQALAIDSRYAAAHMAHGAILKQLGRKSEAETAFARATELAPDMPAYHRALGEVRRYEENDQRLAELEALARQEEIQSVSQKVELHFALFKAFDDLGCYERAFTHLQRGNTLYRTLISYDEAAVSAFFHAQETCFTTERLYQTADCSSELPVFIVGMPRSGTSLVEQMVASHPAVFGAGERTWIQRQAVELLPEYPRTIPLSGLTELGRRYLERLRGLSPTAMRITDKLPANFRNLGLIHQALPKARIIHVQRDPRDTCFSCYSKLFRSGLNFAYDLGELGRYYRAYEKLMAHWRAVLPSNCMLEVQYEALVADFENECRRIVAFCGLEWDESCLRFYENKRPVRTLSEFQVRRPLFTDSIGRWRHYEPWLTPLFEALT